MRRESPDRNFGAKVGFEALLPNRRTVFGAQATQVTFAAKEIDVFAINGWRATRPGGIRDAVRAFVSVSPQFLSSLLVERDQTFAAFEVVTLARVIAYRSICNQIVKNINLAVGNSRPGVTALDWHPPFYFQSRIRNGIDDSSFAKDAIAIVAHPLVPLLSVRTGKWQT